MATVISLLAWVDCFSAPYPPIRAGPTATMAWLKCDRSHLLVEVTGLKPVASRSQGARSSLLSYTSIGYAMLALRPYTYIISDF